MSSGAALAAEGTQAVISEGLLGKVIVPALIAPVLAFAVAGLGILCAYWIIGRLRPGSVNRGFRHGQIVSGGLLALSHGTNDAQKTMGMITLALIANGNLSADNFDVPTWVVISAATAIALGTYAGGWRIIRTLGTRIIKMDPAQGFAAQGAGATVILASSHFGYPLSTTHTISGAIMGAGAAKRLSAVRWGVAGNIVTAWVLTLPAAGDDGRDRLRRDAHLRHRRARPDRRLRSRRRPGRGDLRAAVPPRGAGSGGRGVGAVIATVVDWAALRDVVVASLAAGVGITVTFSLAILGLTRFADMRRDERVVGAWAYAGLAILGLAVSGAAVVFGIILMTSK